MVPQFEFSEYTAQIFWLLVCFYILFRVMKTNILPPVEEIISERENQIKKILRDADQINLKADTILKAYARDKEGIEQKAKEILLKTHREIDKQDENQEKALEMQFQRNVTSAAQEVKENRLLIANHLKTIQHQFVRVFLEVIYGVKERIGK